MEVPAALLCAIYEAATDPDSWPAAINLATEWAGGVVGCLQARRLGAQVESILISPGLEARDLQSYTTHFYKHDPHLVHIERLALSRALLSRDVIADAAMVRTEYYNDFCRPLDLHDLQGVVLLRTTRWAVTYAMFGRKQGAFDEGARNRLNALTPHLSRSLSLGFDFEELAVSEPTLHAALQLQAVVCLHVDETLRLVEAGDCPPSGDVELSDAAPIRIERGALVACSRDDQEKLVAAVRRALVGGTAVITLGQAAHVMTLACAPGPRVSPFQTARCVSVVFAQPTMARAKATAVKFAGLPEYLQPVANALARGLSDKEIASELGYTLPTVRTYVTRVFRGLQVGTRRELMLKL